MSSALYRLLDAAANRCREGLRVVEDGVRFQLDHRGLTDSLKSFRHEITGLLQELGSDRWISDRNTAGDVGTTCETSREYVRESLPILLRANCKRVAEAVRSLEEYGKLLSPKAAQQLEQLRYRFYSLEQAVLEVAIARESQAVLGARQLYLLVTAQFCSGPWLEVVRQALLGGVEIVQLREKGESDAEILERARQIRDLTREFQALFVMNDRPDLALLAEADGVHLGQEDVSVSQARQILGRQSLIGVSTHNPQQLQKAIQDGASYVGLGPTFTSQTKTFELFAGLEYLREASRLGSIPMFAIGGIDPSNVSQVIETGVTRIAVSSAICGATQPEQAARRLRRQLESVRADAC